MPKEIKTFICNKNIQTNIFRIRPFDSVMLGYFSIGFINFMLAGKTLTNFTNLFSPNNFLIKWCYNFKLFYDSCLTLSRLGGDLVGPQAWTF